MSLTKMQATPFVIADIGSHDLIIGKLFLEKFKILVDPANHRLQGFGRITAHLLFLSFVSG